MRAIQVETRARCAMVDVTDEVEAAVRALGLADGAALVHSPHTTAGITINEGYDPDVQRDLLARLAALAPHGGATDGTRDRHAEGNSDAHLKTALVGASALVPVRDGRLALGRWQRVFLCEFDGPRRRTVEVSGVV